jgi:hypothetical protein
MQAMGKEVSFIGKALRGLGSLGGTVIGGLVGQPSAGSAVGSGLGAALSKYLGAGDYVVSKNTLVQRAASGIPAMHNTGQSVVIRHREYVAQISGSVAFTVQQSLYINPGLSATFPWLSGIAARFQEHEIKGMVWHYVPTSGTFNGTTAALGSVMIQTSYRATDANPSSKAEMLNEYWSNEVVPFETMAHPIECDPKENPFNIHYIRNAPVPSGDQLLYDVGRTFVATAGMADTAVVGDLWVTYEIELKKPLIASPVVMPNSYYGVTYASPTTSDLFSGTVSDHIGGAAPCTFATRTLTFPAGSSGVYYVNLQIYNVSGLTAAAVLSWTGGASYTNCTQVGYNPSQSTAVTTNIAGTSTSVLTYSFGVYATDVSALFTIAVPAPVWTTGTPTYCSANIATIPRF